MAYYSSRFKFGLMVIALVGSMAGPVWAQSAPVINPTLLEFVVSPDHNVTVLDPNTGLSVNVVTAYEYSAMVQNSGGAIALTVTLAKPPASDGATVQIPLPGLAQLVNGATYNAFVSAKGPGGVSVASAPSNPFAVVGPIKAPASPSSVKVK